MKYISACFLAFALNFVWPVYGSLLISPTKVAFDSDDKVVEVVLINTSEKVNSYELGWEDKIAAETGGYQARTTNAEFPFSASQMLRFSPRRVTLKPDERQVIRILLRRPRDLAEGEYRSHMRFKAVATETEQAGTVESSGIKINFTTSFSIPVVVRHGQPNVNLVIDRAEIAQSQSAAIPDVTVFISNDSKYSARGDIIATVEDSSGKSSIIARVNDYSLYPELKKAAVKLSWVGTDNAIPDGKLTVSFDGIKEYKGTKFSTKTQQITPRGPLMK